MKVCRLLQVELLVQPAQLLRRTAGTGQRSRVNQVIVAVLHFLPAGFEPFQPFIANVPQIVCLFELVDGKTVAPKVEEGPLPFFLMIHPILNPVMKFRGFLPFITGQGKDAVMGVQFGNIKSHLRLFSVLDDIHG